MHSWCTTTAASKPAEAKNLSFGENATCRIALLWDPLIVPEYTKYGASEFFLLNLFSTKVLRIYTKTLINVITVYYQCHIWIYTNLISTNIFKKNEAKHFSVIEKWNMHEKSSLFSAHKHNLEMLIDIPFYEQ